MPYNYQEPVRSGRDIERNPTADAIGGRDSAGWDDRYQYGQSEADDRKRRRDNLEAAPLFGQTYDDVIGRFGTDRPGEAQYYADIQNRQQAALMAAISAQRHRQMQSDEARGLGGSSIAGANQVALGGIAGRGIADISAGITGQRFGAREDRIAQALAFERAKQMQRLGGLEQRATQRAANKGGGFLGGLGRAVGAAAGFALGGPVGAAAGYSIGGGIGGGSTQGASYGTPGVGNSRPYDPYDPYHNSPVNY